MSAPAIFRESGIEFHATDGEPRIRDLDLAEMLGYERPRVIRDLIGRFINDLGVCRTVRQTSGPLGGRPTEEFWLTEEQALFIVARSETPKATQILKLVISAFVAVRRQIDDADNSNANLRRRLHDILLLAQPAEEWVRMFEPALVRAILQLHGITWNGGPQPQFLSSTYAKIYDLIFARGIGAELKRRNPLPKWGSNHHQHLTKEAREYLAAQLKIVEAIARQSDDKADFWRRMDRQYADGMLQLSLKSGH